METSMSVTSRRSGRSYKDIDVPDQVVNQIIQAALKAPSAKNKQPWKFFVTKGPTKNEIINIIATGVENEEKGSGLLPNKKHLIPSVFHTLEIMRQAPVLIFVYNTEKSNFLFDNVSTEEKFVETSNILSIGAAIENLLLTATDLGVASLWICDTVFAYREIHSYFGEPGQFVSAISLGYALDQSFPKAIKDFDSVVVWK